MQNDVKELLMDISRISAPLATISDMAEFQNRAKELLGLKTRTLKDK